MSFEPDLSDPWVAQANSLRQRWQASAVARDQAGGRPTEQVRDLQASGLPAAVISPAFGGGGASWLSVLRAVRELARTDGSLAHLYGYHHLSLHAVLAHGNAEQQDRWLGGTAKHQWLWGNSGNVMSPSSTGRRLDNGDWILEGHRPFSSGTHVADQIQLSWENADGQRLTAVVPADRAGLVIEDDWDGIGQRQTGSGTVTLNQVHVKADELLGQVGVPLNPFATLVTLLQQSVLLNVFVGSAQGALSEARDYTLTQSRPWIHSGVDEHQQDPWVQRQYGSLYVRTLAATELADQAARTLDLAYQQGQNLSLAQRGHTAVALATANVYAGEVGLAVSSEVFEVMGARSATTELGFDRFWRNVRTHSLHNPAEYKTRTVGHWLLTGETPTPAPYR